MPMEWHHANNPVEFVSKLNNGAGKVRANGETLGPRASPRPDPYGPKSGTAALVQRAHDAVRHSRLGGVPVPDRA